MASTKKDKAPKSKVDKATYEPRYTFDDWNYGRADGRYEEDEDADVAPAPKRKKSK